MTSREFQERLTRRARRAGVVIAADVAIKLEAYYRLLATWNQKINLTGLSLSELNPEAIDRLLVEPLVAARHVPTGFTQMVDIGSGGGSPAIPLALAGGLALRMVESKTRKAVFLREALRSVEMTDGDVVTARFEELLSQPKLHEAHDLLTVRAVRAEMRVLMMLQAFVRPGGQLFLFRGTVAADPSETITPPLTWHATFPLLESLRSRLVVLDKWPSLQQA